MRAVSDRARLPAWSAERWVYCLRVRATGTCSVELLRRVMDASPRALGLIWRVLDWDRRQAARSKGGGAGGKRSVISEQSSVAEEVARVVQAGMKRLERKLEALAKHGNGVHKDGVLRDDTAERIFGLMRLLETDPKKKKAQLLTVFRITVLDGRTQREAATICECKESLVSRRVAELEERFGMSIEELRAYASRVLDLESIAKGERRRKKKHGARPEPDEAGEAEGNGFRGEEDEV